MENTPEPPGTEPDTKAGGPEVCADCGGTGRVGPEVCATCGGSGHVEEDQPTP